MGWSCPVLCVPHYRASRIPVYGDGLQSRCFCHVRDSVRAVVQLLDLAENTSGEIYNIGSNHEVTINQLAQTVIERTETASAITVYSLQ